MDSPIPPAPTRRRRRDRCARGRVPLWPALAAAIAAAAVPLAAVMPAAAATAATPVAVAAAPAAAAMPGAARAHPGVTCPTGTPVVAPTFVPISCGDGSAFAIHVRWTYLSTSLGRAKGAVLLDDCLPNCAQGHYHAYGARLVFSGVATTHGRPYFTRLRIHFTSRHPAGRPTVWTATY